MVDMRNAFVPETRRFPHLFECKWNNRKLAIRLGTLDTADNVEVYVVGRLSVAPLSDLVADKGDCALLDWRSERRRGQ